MRHWTRSALLRCKLSRLFQQPARPSVEHIDSECIFQARSEGWSLAPSAETFFRSRAAWECSAARTEVRPGAVEHRLSVQDRPSPIELFRGQQSCNCRSDSFAPQIPRRDLH